MKNLFFSALAILAMTGCQKGDFTQELSEKPIIAHTNIVQTKAEVSGSSSFDLDYSRTNGTDPSTFGTAKHASNAITFTTPENYTTDNKEAKFRFITKGSSIANPIVSFTGLGAKDIVYNSTVWDAGTYTTPKTDAINLAHALTIIDITCSAETETQAAVQSFWGEITSITVAELTDNMTYDLSKGDFTYGDAKSLAFFGMNQGDFSQFSLTANNTTVNASLMVPAQTIGVAEIKTLNLQITTKNQGVVNTKIDFTGNLTAGKRQKINLIFKAGDKTISATSTVANWTDGETVTGEIK